MLNHLKKAMLALLCGVSFMFPAFTAVASEQLLAEFSYYSAPSTISQNVAHALMEKNGAIVIDVRSKEEYDGGHIEGAYNFPVETLQKHLNELAIIKETKTPVLVYCRSGGRAARAISLLYDNEFEYLMNMGGVLTWEYGLVTEPPQKPLSEAVKEVKRYTPEQ